MKLIIIINIKMWIKLLLTLFISYWWVLLMSFYQVLRISWWVKYTCLHSKDWTLSLIKTFYINIKLTDLTVRRLIQMIQTRRKNILIFISSVNILSFLASLLSSPSIFLFPSFTSENNLLLLFSICLSCLSHVFTYMCIHAVVLLLRSLHPLVPPT